MSRRLAPALLALAAGLLAAAPATALAAAETAGAAAADAARTTARAARAEAILERPALRPPVRAAAVSDPGLLLAARAEHRLADAELLELPGLPAAAAELTVELTLDGEPATIELRPHSIRSADHHRVLIDDGGSDLVEIDPAPLPTVRGEVVGRPELLVAGGLVRDGLVLSVIRADGRRTFIEPAALDAAPGRALHVVYEDLAVIPMPGHACGNEGFGPPPNPEDPPADPGAPVEGGELDVAELACDADFEYFQDYGSVEEVQARIETVMNTVNLQYESEVGITHELTGIVVRTTSFDPYSSFDSFGLLCEFIEEWTENQGAIPRDVAQLFTGRNVDGGTIGRAADIGETGICVNDGGCSGGQFGTFGSYCFSQSDFNGNFASATDLSAHELGHLWGAFHCSCPSFTMNPFITSANEFSGGSISSIIAYRNTRSCLNVPAEPITPGPCCLPNGFCVTTDTEGGCTNQGGTFLGPNGDCAECDQLVGACCLPTGACVELDEATCVAAGGTFAGNGTTCAGGGCDADCPADVDGDGDVAFGDLLEVLSSFGPCDGCPEDVSGDGTVGFDDVLEVLATFGPCP